MRPLNARGFTLIEMALAIVLLGLVSGLFASLVLASAREASRALEALVAARTGVALATYFGEELRDGSLRDVTVAPDHATLPVPIGEAFVCADSGTVILLADSDYAGVRLPEAIDDSLALVGEGDSLWQSVALDSVGAGHCPGGASARRLVVAPHVGLAIALRVRQALEVRIYHSGSDDWLGIAPADHHSTVQPFAGPLRTGASQFARDSSGLRAAIVTSRADTVTVMAPLGP